MHEGPPEPPPGESPRKLTAEALVYLGILVSIGGVAALLRLAEFVPFYAALIPIGLAMGATGLWLNRNDSST